MEKLSDIIHKARIELGITMRELARRTGLSVMYVSDIENENKIPIKGEGLKKLSEQLKLNYTNLVGIAKQTKINKLLSKSNINDNDIKCMLAREISELDVDGINDLVNFLKERSKN